MIKIENVSKIYSAKKNIVRALDNISLEIEQGDIFGVIGFSGAGKSTLLRMVNALEKPSSGKVLVKNIDVSTLKGARLRAFRKDIGMIFQHFNLLSTKTVFQNIALPMKLVKIPKPEIKKRVLELLNFVGLEDKKDSYPGELSGGQKQRVGIARALALNPSILLCDEATSALDPRTTDSILGLLRKVNSELKVTILMITHQMNVISSLCNKVAVLEKGRLVESGAVIDVFGNPRTETTKGFIKTVINDRLPESVVNFIKSYKEPQKILRLRFDGENAAQPLMSMAVRNIGVNISILYGTVTELEGKVVGFQTVQITGTKAQIEDAEAFFEERKVPKFEITF